MRQLQTLSCTLFLLFSFVGCQEKTVYSPEQAKKRFLTAYETHLKKTAPKFEILHDIYSRKDRGFIGIKGMVRGEYKKEEALHFFTVFITDFLQFANTSPFTDFFYPKNLRDLQRCEMVLTFWTEEMDRPRAEFAAEIRLARGEITYFHKEVDTEFLDMTDTTCVALNELE